jgi:hypothetical protein
LYFAYRDEVVGVFVRFSCATPADVIIGVDVQMVLLLGEDLKEMQLES